MGPGGPAGGKRSVSLRPPSGLEALTLHLGEEELVVFRLPRLAPRAPPELTNAERAVALLALQGLRSAQIARARRTSERTIANQLASVFRKLGIGSRAELARALVQP